MTLRLVIALVAAAAIGALLGYAASEERSRSEAAGERTVTVTMTAAEATAPDETSGPRPNPRAGRRVFARACARCHALEPGNWTGNKVNLTALQPDYATAVVKVTRGGIAMPSFAGRLSERQIRDVAAFVSTEAERRGTGTR